MENWTRELARGAQMSADSRILDLLVRWEELRQAGASPRIEDLCRDCPELLPAVRAQIEALDSMGGRLDVATRVAEPSTGGWEKNPGLGAIELRTGAEPVPGYHLVERLGKGGFGEVWRAEGPGGFSLALKFVPGEGKSGEAETRALKIIRELRHPHLIHVFGTWHVRGMIVIGMELAERTLWDRYQEVTRQGTPGIPRDELLTYLRDAARALDYLNSPQHRFDGQGEVSVQHRDIKPQNLLLVGGGLKVADLGLARLLHERVTGHTGSMTAAYAAPEFFGGQTSRWSDQYSLGVTYCVLRGGRAPFTGGPAQLMHGHLYEPPDLSMLPEQERLAVARALHKKPERRWPTSLDFVTALGQTTAGTIGFALAQLLTVAQLAHELEIAPHALMRSARDVLGLEIRTPGATLQPAQVTRLRAHFRNAGLESQSPAARLAIDLGDGAALELVFISPGRFTMGSPRGEDGHNEDEIEHDVRLSQGIYLGQQLVTQEQYQRVMGDNPSYFQGPLLPVEMVSWFDAAAFCDELSRRVRRAFRLPTEAEWEYACRAGTTTPFNTGSSLSTDQANYDGQFSYSGRRTGVSRRQTTPVNMFPPNAWGLYDMHGNLWEWCNDWYSDYGTGSVVDPAGPETGSIKVLRGGSWFHGPADCRSAQRDALDPGRRHSLYGIRVAMDAG